MLFNSIWEQLFNCMAPFSHSLILRPGSTHSLRTGQWRTALYHLEALVSCENWKLYFEQLSETSSLRRFPIARSGRSEQSVLKWNTRDLRTGLLVDKSRSVQFSGRPKAQDFGELWREKCTSAHWTFPFKLPSYFRPTKTRGKWKAISVLRHVSEELSSIIQELLKKYLFKMRSLIMNISDKQLHLGP